ncbi:MAG: thioredoxin domain-containing protein [Holosporales bacterium]|jgi:predicted DsbA family dithiol-disulfide isomerase|nr:thioredoxin domain-containing protein [Holosporales bacterium]
MNGEWLVYEVDFFMNLKKVLVYPLAAVALVGCDKSDSLSEKQKTEVEGIVDKKIAEMLEKEPGKLLAAIEKAMQQQQQQAAKKIETSATEQQQKFWEAKLVIGNRDAQIKVCVFIDPLEPVSQKFREDVMEPLVKERSDVGFFIIPVSVYAGGSEEMAQSSLLAAQAVIAASWQSPERAIALWAKLSINKEVTRTTVLKVAEEVGLDREKLAKGMESQEAREVLIENGKLAVQLGVPPQLPVIFVRKSDGSLEIIPPFIKDKIGIVFDAIRDDKPWEPALAASVRSQTEQTESSSEEVTSKASEVGEDGEAVKSEQGDEDGDSAASDEGSKANKKGEHAKKKEEE